MNLIWHGHSCFEMDYESGLRVLTDPFDDHVGYPLCTAEVDIVTNSHAHGDHNYLASVRGNYARINRPGRFVFEEIAITGVPAYHDDQNGAKRGRNILFIFEAEGLKIAHLGDLGHMPGGAQIEALENLDVMLVPIGGFYTIDTPTALSLIALVKPKIAVAMHFKTKSINFPVSDEAEFVRRAGAQYAHSRGIELTRGNIATYPGAIVLDYPE